ncbi:hypothetical protein [Neptuniibacter halophilus]|uniref:hypothetical protein n=1 Tax=Neptuniibacter halophilus TaxID=651666 RepID=UPI002572F740|nr:hypothetical protein [Neptuniibacter halophilus]
MEIEQGWFNWEKARPLVRECFSFWEDGEDILWAKQCWPALDKKGLTIFFSEKEEMKVRSYVAALGIIYSECMREYQESLAGYRNSDDDYYNDHLFNGFLNKDYIGWLLEEGDNIAARRISDVFHALIDCYTVEGLFSMTAKSIISGIYTCSDAFTVNSEAQSWLEQAQLEQDRRHTELLTFFQAGPILPGRMELLEYGVSSP